MQIIKVTPRGYCKGVVRAIEIAKRTRKEHPNVKISILGMLVHNQSIVDALKAYQIDTIDSKGKTRLELLDEIDEGIVIFTAHGVSDQVIEKAQKKGLTIVDATCEYVSLIHRLVKKKLEEGYEIAYIGKKGHPESEAVLEISHHVHLIESIQDLNFHADKLFVTNQTTLGFDDITSLYEQIHLLYPHAQIHNEICNATRLRQQALKELPHVDALIVVGDPQSHNTLKLVEIGKKHADQVFLIENLNQCLTIDFSQFEKVAVTSGASTPTKITQQIIHYLENQVIEELDIDQII